MHLLGDSVFSSIIRFQSGSMLLTYYYETNEKKKKNIPGKYPGLRKSDRKHVSLSAFLAVWVNGTLLKCFSY